LVFDAPDFDFEAATEELEELEDDPPPAFDDVFDGLDFDADTLFQVFDLEVQLVTLSSAFSTLAFPIAFSGLAALALPIADLATAGVALAFGFDAAGIIMIYFMTMIQTVYTT